MQYSVNIGINGLLKIANRNWNVKRECFEINAICFFESGIVAGGSCDYIEPIGIEPTDNFDEDQANIVNSSIFGDNVWSPMTFKDKTRCWEPYQQYLVYNLTDFVFASIGYESVSNILYIEKNIRKYMSEYI